MGRGSDGPGAPGTPGLAPELAAHREKTVALIAEWYKADRCAPPRRRNLDLETPDSSR